MKVTERLKKIKVLLILDDVNHVNQLTWLCGSKSWFGSGSRIIIITRDKHLLKLHGVKDVYSPEELKVEDALKLFTAFAFPRKENVPDDYLELAHLFLKYAEGLPLALVSLGQKLRGRTIAQWKEELNAPSYLKSCLYDSRQEQITDVFLDIAFFFNGQDKNQVIQILEGCGKPDTYLSELEEKALICIDEKNHIIMRTILADMGKNMVHCESPDNPGERSRLWFFNDVYAVLTKCRGTEKIRGILVPRPQEDPVIPLIDGSFSMMTNLKFFISSNAKLSGNFGNLPKNLRLIDWPDFPSLSLPSSFIPEKFVKLSLTRSKISKLGVNFKCCKHLKYMNLERSEDLTEVLNFSNYTNLLELNLSYCTSLTRVDLPVELDKLVVLNLSGCSNLKTVFPSEAALKSVKCIDLSGCSNLTTFCESVIDMKVLASLDLSGTAISQLPRNIHELHGLVRLDLQNCTELVTFPMRDIDQRLPDKLRILNLCGCKKLKEIHELTPNVEQVIADGCESLDRFAVLSNILEPKPTQMVEHISLYNCQSICDNLPQGMAGHEVTLFSLIHSSKQSQFHIVFPGSDVPSWFKHRKFSREFVEKCEFLFEVPLNFNKGLAICASATATTPTSNSGECSFATEIYIKGESKHRHSFCFKASKMHDSRHVWLLYIPFAKLGHFHPPFTCQVYLKHAGQSSVSCTSYGMHLVRPQDVYENHADDTDSEDENCSASEDDADLTE